VKQDVGSVRLDSRPLPVQIPRGVLVDAYRDARATFPSECCGWLAGPKGGAAVTIVRQCVNAQASGTHPTAASRGAETAYVIGGEDLMELNRSFEGESPALVIYHSHPNGQAYLSPTDREVATSPWGDGPAYPVQQLVIGIDAEGVVEAALFAWSDEEAGFVEAGRYEGATI
jgi:proteasome lid subunit RPN8/RPN11